MSANSDDNLFQRVRIPVDGVASINFNGSQAKIDFFISSPSNDNNGNLKEHKKVTHEVVMPTRQLIEWMMHTIKSIKEDEESFLTMYDSEKEAIRNCLHVISKNK